MSEVSSWATTAAGNAVAFDDIDNRDGRPRAQGKLNDRAIMAAVRRWQGQRVSVKDYGAVGDGVADDSAAFAAMNAALGATWGLGDPPVMIYFPAGVYRYASGLTFDFPVSLYSNEGATLDYTGNSFAIRLGPLNLLNSPTAFSYQECTVDGLRFTGGASAVHGIYISDSIFEPRIRNCTFMDFGGPTGGSVYCIYGQANNWNAIIENVRMWVLNRPSASGVNFIAVNGVSENGVPDGGNSRVTIRDCWMTGYEGNTLGIFANINAVASRVVGGGFQWSSRGIFLKDACNDVTIDTVYCEQYTNNASFIEHSSSGSGATYQSPQYVKVLNCYVNLHVSDGVTGGRVIRPFDAAGRLVNWTIDNLTVTNIAAGQVLVEQNNLTGQVGNSFSNVQTLFVPRASDNGTIRPNFPQIQSNVDAWACRDQGVIRSAEASFTLTREDANAVINCTGAAMTVTVPPSGALPFIPVGSFVEFRNATAGNITISQGAGVSLVLPAGVGNRTLASNGYCRIRCTESNVWAVTGNGVT